MDKIIDKMKKENLKIHTMCNTLVVNISTISSFRSKKKEKKKRFLKMLKILADPPRLNFSNDRARVQISRTSDNRKYNLDFITINSTNPLGQPLFERRSLRQRFYHLRV